MNPQELQDASRQIALIDNVPSADAPAAAESADTQPARRLSMSTGEAGLHRGLVQVGFVVGVDGRISRVVVEDAVGRDVRKLERETREALERWTFVPATLRGQPVPQAGGGFNIYSYLSGEDTVSAGFAKQYERASERLTYGNLEEAGEAIDDLLERVENSREFINYSLLEARFAVAADSRRQYRAIARAVRHASRTELTPLQKYQLLQVKFSLEVKTRHLATALETYRDIQQHSLYSMQRDEDIETLAAQFEVAC